ncbi:ATP-grasp domain-containing protein [Acidilutibacter cellobiosedens]|jgi:D-alanine-D-alanine ligase|uniref:ATP-grasp domain-containing protein n=1 Tax=Acidilutibacter cellobiosedens TaxID=2507161 RepID=A0A410Q9R8_9FIRM|nr:ATP-grasp domain-containing protein [Acidilutibacter cellobiosedens]QAT60731.1 ATP-grasp domain-containing protein [Acidilutibacter cellobiosedens]
MRLKIGLISDKPQGETNCTAETKHTDIQKKSTNEEIYKVLKKKYDVVEIIADNRIIKNLIESKIDLAFPLCTGISGESRQSQVPAILEMLRIPYIGSGILAHSLSLNKAVAKQIFAYNNILTPSFQIFNTAGENFNMNLKFPLIVKPSCEGSGFGIHKDSVVYNKQDLMGKIKSLLKSYCPPVLAEEFIKGREFTIGIIGNGSEKRFLPIMEINFDDVPEKFGKFYTFEVKSQLSEKTKYICPASINKDIELKIKNSAGRAFDALGCRDFARVDVRLKEDQPYVLEINSLPGLKSQYSDLPKMALKEGLSYDELIFNIVEISIRRINKDKRYMEEKVSDKKIS